MNRTDLIASIANKTGFTKKDSETALDAVLSSIQESLVSGNKVQLVGFGSFEVKDRAERIGRNPQTREEMTIPASRVPVFKAGKSLKEVVNNSK